MTFVAKSHNGLIRVMSLHKRHDFYGQESPWFNNCTNNHNDENLVYKCSLKSDRIYFVIGIL